MKYIHCCIVLSFFSPLLISAAEYELENYSIDLPEKWYIQTVDGEMGMELRKRCSNAQLKIGFSQGITAQQQTETFLNDYDEGEAALTAIQLGQFSGYFLSYEDEGMCGEIWSMANGEDHFGIGYWEDCNSINRTLIFNLVNSIKPRLQVAD
ncbi:hypothetical protein Misp06_02229 [Microbulbifer sp. NBRC 101763]|uniref:hypothetical protein n=1 Tax=Microbulbifer TaxID=48073 RepID=UPI0003790439|nr:MULTISPECIES: hypothetical protein [Microbulbifer]WHI52061.1 hypothetical protein P3339_04395 [Microbulbifer sp. MLAF003]